MSRAKGNIAEQKAVKYLLDNNFKILEQNFYSRFGEIDIVATKQDTLHFVEVKSGLDYETAIANITPTKLSKLIKTGYVYIKKHNLNTNFVHDAIILTPTNIEFIENITL